MKILIVIQLDKGERKPKMLKPDDIEKFKNANPGLQSISDITLYPNEKVEVSRDGVPMYYFNRN